MFKIGDKVLYVSDDAFEEWGDSFTDSTCENFTITFNRINHNILSGITGTIVEYVELGTTIGYIVRFENNVVALPVYCLTPAPQEKSIIPSTNIIIPDSISAVITQKVGSNNEDIQNYIVGLIKRDTEQTVKTGLNPEVFRELAYELADVNLSDVKNKFYQNAFDSPESVCFLHLPTEYYSFFEQMFKPQNGERNYWWRNPEFIFGPSLQWRSQVKGYVETTLLPNPKSHLSQVIMALLFCAEMCE